MGHLICKKCGGYYELEEGESPEDFDSCSCGGELEHRLSSNEQKSISYDEEDPEGEKKSNKMLIIILAIVAIFLLLIILIIPSLLIYNSTFTGSGTLNSSADINPVRTSRMILPLFGYYW